MVNELDLDLLGVGVDSSPLDGVGPGEVQLFIELGLGDLEGCRVFGLAGFIGRFKFVASGGSRGRTRCNGRKGNEGSEELHVEYVVCGGGLEIKLTD